MKRCRLRPAAALAYQEPGDSNPPVSRHKAANFRLAPGAAKYSRVSYNSN
jgi:hypothetical protein